MGSTWHDLAIAFDRDRPVGETQRLDQLTSVRPSGTVLLSPLTVIYRAEFDSMRLETSETESFLWAAGSSTLSPAMLNTFGGKP